MNITETIEQAKRLVELADMAKDRPGLPSPLSHEYRDITALYAADFARALVQLAEQTQWRDISTAPKDGTRVDLWFNVYASPLSMGWSDAFMVQECWWRDDRWEHAHNGELKALNAEYITHWKPLEKGPEK